MHTIENTLQYILPGEHVFSESIGYQPSSGHFFVGSLLDGQILRGQVDGPEAIPFLPAGTDDRTQAAGIKVDERGRLFVAGGSTGKLWIYDIATTRLLASLDAGSEALLNDIAILSQGDAYVTDSSQPILYRIQARHGERSVLEPWLRLEGTPIAYESGLNLNGIIASADERYLVVDQTNTGKLFRVSVESREVIEIDLADDPLLHGDGILLDGQTLYVVRNAENLLVVVDLDADLLSGWIRWSGTYPAFRFPTALAKAGDRLLIVNGQLDRMGPDLHPDLPFTVTSIPDPAQERQEEG